LEREVYDRLVAAVLDDHQVDLIRVPGTTAAATDEYSECGSGISRRSRARATACSRRDKSNPLGVRRGPRPPGDHKLRAQDPSKESPASQFRASWRVQYPARPRDC